jgi:hypothetical protein
MDTPPIPPFVFVDGRKYVLAEDEERPVPEIFDKLTSPPRNVTAWVKWRVRLRRKMELQFTAFFAGCCCCAGILWALGVNAMIFNAFIGAMCIPMIPIVFIMAQRCLSDMRKSASDLQLLQNGFVGKGRFFGMCSTVKTVHNFPEMQFKYQFAMEDGNSYNTSFSMTDLMTDVMQHAKNMRALSDESLKLIFYDPTKPKRNLLFDALPKGIWFDDSAATFRTAPLLLIIQILWLCVAFAAVPMITLTVYAFSC